MEIARTALTVKPRQEPDSHWNITSYEQRRRDRAGKGYTVSWAGRYCSSSENTKNISYLGENLARISVYYYC